MNSASEQREDPAPAVEPGVRGGSRRRQRAHRPSVPGGGYESLTRDDTGVGAYHQAVLAIPPLPARHRPRPRAARPAPGAAAPAGRRPQPLDRAVRRLAGGRWRSSWRSGR